jgi:hypothetical protein
MMPSLLSSVFPSIMTTLRPHWGNWLHFCLTAVGQRYGAPVVSES